MFFLFFTLVLLFFSLFFLFFIVSLFSAQCAQDSGKTVSTPVVREPEPIGTHGRPLLDRNRASIFRSVCVRRYTAKEAASQMHGPSERG